MTKTKTHSGKHSRKHSQKHTQKKTDKKPMEIEFEGRILDINPEELIAKIKAVGGKLKKELTLYRRSVFGLCDIKRGFVRVRDEGDKVTMTAKIYKDPKFPQEYELQLKDNFENGQAFLEALNLNKKAYHETMREKWSIPKPGKNKHGHELCEVAIDYIPGLPVYAELECKTKEDLHKTAKLLNVKVADLMYGGYGKVFVHYYDMAENEINNVIPSLTFKNIKTELKPYIHKNEDILKRVARTHLDVYKTIKKN
jgi:adenylate cyclase class 2